MPDHLREKDGTVAYVVWSSVSPKYTIKGIKNNADGTGGYISEEMARVPAEVADTFITWFSNNYPYSSQNTDDEPLRYIKILEI